MDNDLTTLPVFGHLQHIHREINNNPVTLLSATPGSGKTLLVAPYLINNSDLRIAMLQPRRVAARMSADSIAQFNQWTEGKEVGLLMKDVHKRGRNTRLTIMTEGVLSRMLASGDAQKSFDLIILDEFHERSIHTDLACAWIKQQNAVKLLAMSATLDIEPLKAFFPKAVMIEIEGRTYPIENHYLKRAVNFHDRQAFEDALLSVCRRALDSVNEGSVLVFLPGRRQILQARDQFLNQGLDRDYGVEIHTLYGQASKEEQKKALSASPQRKLILATNIAETSLTIPNVRAVVDSGLQKESHYNALSGVHSLSMHRIALDGATQRAGRAGRQQAGQCFKMWTPADETRFRKTKPAEIHRVDPIEFLLKVYSFGTDPKEFDCIEKPMADQMALATKRLQAAACLVGQKFTDLGRWISQFPGDFSLGVLAAVAMDTKFQKEALLSILILQEGDPAPFISQQDNDQSLDDLRSRLKWLKEHPNHAYHKSAVALEKKAKAIATPLAGRPNIETFEEALVYAFPHRICRHRDKKKIRGIMSTGRGVKVPRARTQTKSEYYIALKLMDHKLHGQSESEVQFLTDVHKKTIAKVHEERIHTKTLIESRGKKGLPKAYAYRCLWDLPLEEPQGQPLDKTTMVNFQKEKFAERGLATLDKHPKSLELVRRTQFCAHHRPDMGWPEFSKEDWELIIEAAYSDTDNLELTDENWRAAIAMLLTESQLSFLDSFAPTSLATKIRKLNPISYETPTQPKVSIILQEAFEFQSSPLIGNGTVTLAVELLAPSRRPIEVSKDMKQFWISSYPEVRKHYRGRYPKHAWPEKVNA